MITELGAARSLRGPWRSLSSPPTRVLASQHSSASRVISFAFIYPAKTRLFDPIGALYRSSFETFASRWHRLADIERLLMISAKRPDRKSSSRAIFAPPVCTWHFHSLRSRSFFVITRCYIVRFHESSRTNEPRVVCLPRQFVHAVYIRRPRESTRVALCPSPPLEWHWRPRRRQGRRDSPESEIHSRAFRIISRSAMLFSAHIPKSRRAI